MQRKTFMTILRILLILILVVIIVPTMQDYFNQPTPEEANIGYNASSVYAAVHQIIEEGTIILGDVTQPYQIFLVKILD